ncbi:AbrB/MazE/SpoVT family DNA-binding domain-containing protein [Labrys wisconsinensis]|uniref:Antitoxin ChpS n=1 Tax=Labrys wisconsinensis TaxID=425677 RepID=A0ABU0J086_9HYPH|nr:antitoxin [Labrys wisconsinensis]MDQ0467681.1 antitoxin ChpS [Labrys wisconsinensis]
MTTAKLRKVGGSLMPAIPPALLDELGVGVDTAVDTVVRGDELVMRPARKRYTLDELLARCDPAAPSSDEDRAWLGDGPVGCEAV